jgi:hypothetical protein
VPGSPSCSAHVSPLASVVATHHESRSPGVTYFQHEGTGPAAIVEEIPERADNGTTSGARTPLDIIFSYRLLTPAFAGSELARWALKPIPAAWHQPKPPGLTCFMTDLVIDWTLEKGGASPLGRMPSQSLPGAEH